MNPELKAKWVEALRSGKYKQAKGQLCDKNGAMCCLGVLREIMEPGSKESLNNDNMILSARMAILAGLQTTGRNHPQGTLGELNDSGRTFHEISDYIERYL